MTDPEQKLELLRHGVLEIVGRIIESSNSAFLTKVSYHGETSNAIYKPEATERDLWDFEPGLWKREVAAYYVAIAIGSDFVPPTVARLDEENLPAGIGSLQLFIDGDFSQTYFSLRDSGLFNDQLFDVAIFDLIVNNADRKGGHFIVQGGKIYAIDHGLCFHENVKLRTVIWDFNNREISEQKRDEVRNFLWQLIDDSSNLRKILSDLLSKSELNALIKRTRAVYSLDRFPDVPEDLRPYPWPVI